MKIEKREHVFYRRDFLNKEYFNSNATILGEITVGWFSGIRKYSGKQPDFEEIKFMISDCHRIINMEFSIDDKEEFENSIHKLEKLENFAHDFKESLYNLKDYYKENLKKGDEDPIVKGLFDEFSKYFAFNKLNNKSITDFDIDKIDENVIDIKIYDVLPNDLDDRHFINFKYEMQNKFNIKINAYTNE